MLTDERMFPWRWSALGHGYKSSAAIPLKYGGATFGVLNIYADESYSFTPQRLQLLEELASNMASAIITLHGRAKPDAE